MATLPANGSSRFSPTEQPAILAALEEFTNALAIYHNTQRKPTKHDNDILVGCSPLNIDELNILNPEETTKIQDAISKKISENSLCMRKMMEELKKEIREQGIYKILTKEIDEDVVRGKEEEALLEKQGLGKTATELKKIIAEEKAANEQEKRRILNEFSKEQRHSLEKQKLIANAMLEYVAEWEKARYEQNSLRYNMEIEKLERILSDWCIREKNQQRVHEELTKFLIQETASLEEKTKEWEVRYVQEKGTYEKEIWQLRIEIETRRKELDELKEEYRHNQEFIDTYLAEKEVLRKEKEQRERMQKSAIKIQAWWRGVMVRQKLGPYRPAEKKKKRQTKTKK